MQLGIDWQFGERFDQVALLEFFKTCAALSRYLEFGGIEVKKIRVACCNFYFLLLEDIRWMRFLSLRFSCVLMRVMSALLHLCLCLRTAVVWLFGKTADRALVACNTDDEGETGGEGGEARIRLI
jgi:hypothetical protein